MMTNRWALCVSMTLLLVLAGCGGAATTAGRDQVQPTGPPTPTPAPTMSGCVPDDAKRLTLGQGAGRTAAAIMGDGDTGVVLSNMRGSDACGWLPLAERLVEDGYRVLLFRFRDDRDEATSRKDVARAAAALRDRGAATVFLIGASWGGTISVLNGTSITPRVAGVICLSGGVSGSAAVASRLRVPVLFIAAEADGRAPGLAREMYDAATHAPDRQLMLVPGDVHGSLLLDPVYSEHSADIRARILAFLGKHAAAG